MPDSVAPAAAGGRAVPRRTLPDVPSHYQVLEYQAASPFWLPVIFDVCGGVELAAYVGADSAP